MTHLDFVKKYDDILSNDMCHWLMNTFEDNIGNCIVNNNKVYRFTEMNLNKFYPDRIKPLIDATKLLFAMYKREVGYDNYFPKQMALEEFRVKRYNGDTDEQFGTHVDIGDYASARRYLAFIYYLNDGYEGGETTFIPDAFIHPRKGSVVVFPPFWQYPHAGLPVTEGTKYIMSTYLHYT